MPRREWKQKNTLKVHAKRPTEVYAAIRKQYCKGKTYAETTAIVSRWARIRGLKGVSRQTVSKHYADAGEKLWYLMYVTQVEEAPPRYVSPQEETNYIRRYLYYSQGTVTEERFRYEVKPYLRKMNPKGHDWLFGSKLVDTLRDASKRFRGLPENTLFIQYARAYWLEKFCFEQPHLTDRERAGLIYETLQEAEKIFVPRDQRLDVPKPTEPVIDHYDYYKLGHNLIRMTIDPDGNNAMTEKYNKQTGEFEINYEYMMMIMFGDPDDLRKISEEEFYAEIRALIQPVSGFPSKPE